PWSNSSPSSDRARERKGSLSPRRPGDPRRDVPPLRRSTTLGILKDSVVPDTSPADCWFAVEVDELEGSSASGGALRSGDNRRQSDPTAAARPPARSARPGPRARGT